MWTNDLYHFGKGVQQDNAAAYAWTLKAAEHGDPCAQTTLGVMHQEGWGTRRDDAEAAVVWFRKAADGGNADAFSLLWTRMHRKRARPAYQR